MTGRQEKVCLRALLLVCTGEYPINHIYVGKRADGYTCIFREDDAWKVADVADGKDLNEAVYDNVLEACLDLLMRNPEAKNRPGIKNRYLAMVVKQRR